MDDGRPPACNSVKHVSGANSLVIQGNDDLAKFGIFLKGTFWQETERLGIGSMKRHDSFQMSRWPTEAFKYYSIAHDLRGDRSLISGLAATAKANTCWGCFTPLQTRPPPSLPLFPSPLRPHPNS